MPIRTVTTPRAQRDIDDLDATVQADVEAKIRAIGSDWPEGSRKPLKGPWRGHFRVQVRKDWRIILKPEGGMVVVVRVFHRSSRGYDEGGSRDMSRSSRDAGGQRADAGLVTARGRGMPPRNEAAEYVRWSLGRNLLQARKAGKLTQQELARKIGKAQSTVSMSEKGQISVSRAYVLAVLRACGVPSNWNRKMWKEWQV